MAPKYRGGSDDFIDDQSGRSSRKASSKKPQERPAAEALPDEQANATVVEVFHKQCRVALDAADSTTQEVLCSYRRAAVLDHGKEDGKDLRERSPVTVGDRVQVELTGSQTGVVLGMCRRTNQLYRQAPGRDLGNVHVIAANLDALVIVASVDAPLFSPGLIDRYLIAAQAARISPILCVTKSDLLKTSDQDPPWKIYQEIEVPVFEVCSKTGVGVDPLRDSLINQRVAFCGHSGVGKTSLLRALLGADVGKVGEVSEVTGKGRHTTTSSVLFSGPSAAKWIDTPGIRGFGLMDIKPEELFRFYAEFRDLDCRSPGCLHLEEDGCEAHGLVRYETYRRIHQSLVEGES